MKVFFDCEFMGLHQNTKLISIGLIAEDGRTFYAESNEYDVADCDVWLLGNVIAKLNYNDHAEYGLKNSVSDNVRIKGSLKEISERLIKWLNAYDLVKFVSDCLAYDWVLLNELWGGALNAPKNVYYIPFDICTLFEVKGIDPDINREYFAGLEEGEDAEKHNALWDAAMIKNCYEIAIDM